jgi:hypothetical protein
VGTATVAANGAIEAHGLSAAYTVETSKGTIERASATGADEMEFTVRHFWVKQTTKPVSKWRANVTAEASHGAQTAPIHGSERISVRFARARPIYVAVGPPASLGF